MAVIGGGISGLAAAFRLRELLLAVELRLFEAGPRLGGILDTVRRDGYLIEHSADSFLTNNPRAMDFFRRLGFADQLIPTNPGRQAFVVHEGRLEPVPAGFLLLAPRQMWPVLTSRILSLRGKLRAGSASRFFSAHARGRRRREPGVVRPAAA